MKVIALCSGGKDSTYNMMECVRHGHEIVALINLRPPHSLSVRNEQPNSQHVWPLFNFHINLKFKKKKTQMD